MLSIQNISWNHQKRFWAKIDVRGPGDCWLWKGSKSARGYGKLWILEKIYGAHRIAVILSGRSFDVGMQACHRCDVPSCCNPEHLFVGTRSENKVDAMNKGRVPRGERHGKAKLSEDTVIEILSLKNTGLTQTEIGSRFGINFKHVSSILTGRSWGHLINAGSKSDLSSPTKL